MIWSNLLLNKSRELLRYFKRHKTIIIPDSKIRLFFAYQTENVENVPSELIEHLMNIPVREMAVSTEISGSKKRSSPSVFLVAVIAN